jgi:undecaprenyl-diphosphatase
MDLVNIILLSLIQGITEFLPISSSAHLIIFSEIINNSNQDITVDVFAHFGTLLAVIWYFREDLIKILRTYKISEVNNLGNCLIIGTLPILFFGFFLRDFIEVNLRNQNVIVFSMIFFGILLLIFEYLRGNRNLEDLTWKDSIILGLFQTFAMIPGASRSALVIMGAFYLGFRSIDALKISFLFAIPTLALIFLGENYLINFEYKINILELLLVVFFSFLTACVTIHFFLKLVNKIGLLPFVIYRFLLAGILVFT